jgi:hypothetical protein
LTGPIPRQNGLRLIAIRSSSLIAAALLLFVSARLVLDYLPRFGLPPCEGPDWLFHSLRGLVGVLIVLGIWLQLRLQHNPGLRRLALTLVVPLAALGVQEAANRHEARAEKQCRGRTLPQAMMACQANPAHYRLGEGEYGTPVLSLVPPGATGPAWNCLQAWATYQNDISLTIDEGVYRARGN